jgi:hypothetical protein
VLFRHAPSVIDTALITAAFHTHPKLLTGIYLHIRTPPCYLYTQATFPSALPHQPDPAHLTFRRPVALPSYPPNPTHDSSAPRRQLDGGVAPAADCRGGGRARPGSPAAELSWLVGRPDGGCPAERPAGIQRSGVVAVVGHARMPAMASVAGPRPPCGVHSAVPSSGSGGPVSGRPVSSASSVQPVHVRPSGVHPSGVRPSGVHPSGVQPAAVRPRSVRTRPARPTPGGGGTRSRRRATVTTGAGRVPVGCRVVERLDRRPSRPGRGRGCRGRVDQWGRSRTRARWGAGVAALDRLSDQASQAGVQSAVACGCAVAREQAPARGAAAAAWLPLLGWGATTVGGGHGACRPGGRVRRGLWPCWRGGRAAPARPRLAAGAHGSLPAAL